MKISELITYLLTQSIKKRYVTISHYVDHVGIEQGGLTAGPLSNFGPRSNFFGSSCITGDLHV